MSIVFAGFWLVADALLQRHGPFRVLCLTGGLFIVFVVGALQAYSAQVRGIVFDARTGEPLSSIEVRVFPAGSRTYTDQSGRFQLSELGLGQHELQVTAIGYEILVKTFEIREAEETIEFEILLVPVGLSQRYQLTVRSDPFGLQRTDSPVALQVEGHEIQNLASVLADDAIRSVKTLPGITANNDFDSRFHINGASFRNIGLYVDNALMHSPFHAVQGHIEKGSASILAGETVEAVQVYPAAFPPRFGDRTAAVLEIQTRQPERSDWRMRVSTGLTTTSVLSEGPFARGKGGWLVNWRIGYPRYIVERVTDDPTLTFNLSDLQAKVDYDVTAHHRVEAAFIGGGSSLDRRRW